MHLGSPLDAHQQAAELVQPGEAALHRPADAPEPGAVRGRAAGDLGPDAATAQLAAVGVVVVAAVGHEDLGAPARAAHLAGDRRHRVHQRDQLGDVVAVAAGQRDRERDARPVGEKVVLGARPAPVDRARARRGAPFFARTWPESTIAREKSIASAARSSPNRTW